MGTVLFLDSNNLAIRTLFSDREMVNTPNPDFTLHKHLFLNAIFANMKKFNPSEVVLAVDDRKNWRKSVYADYKKHRKENRDKDIFPWDAYFVYMDDWLKEIKEHLPFKVIQLPYTEADDVIAVISKHLVDTKNIIVTSDSDYVQLLSQKNIKVWDPFKKAFLAVEDPKKELAIKVLAGDSGDGVPNVRPKLGPKTAEKLYVKNEIEKFISENNLQAEYERNQRLIDFNFIPAAVTKRILESYSSYPVHTKVSTNALFIWFVKNSLRKMSEDAQEITFLLKRCIEHEGDLF